MKLLLLGTTIGNLNFKLIYRYKTECMKLTLKHIITGVFIAMCVINSNAAVKYKITVAKDGSGDYKTIQEAINDAKSFPDSNIIITIKPGVYEEKVCVYSWNNKLTLRGEDPTNTIIKYNDNFKSINLGRNSTFHTYTVKIEANETVLENITIINSSGAVGQAVALHVEGDKCKFINCKILGNQDTLYADGKGARQYFYNCFIEGTTDFIFGQAIAVFNKCTLKSLSNSYITAASTTKEQEFGFVFIECKLIAEEKVNEVFLGRPWRDYAKTVFVNCDMGKHISPSGWANWSGTQRNKTAFYAEYNSRGEGKSTKNRVEWSHKLSKKEAEKYTINNVFSTSDLGIWNPAD